MNSLVAEKGQALGEALVLSLGILHSSAFPRKPVTPFEISRHEQKSNVGLLYPGVLGMDLVPERANPSPLQESQRLCEHGMCERTM